MTTGQSRKSRILLAISVQPTDILLAEIDAGRQPRRDYLAIREALDANLISPDDTQRSLTGRFIRRLFGTRIAVAWTAFLRRHEYDIIYTDTEIVGLPLAMLLLLDGIHSARPRHVTLTHYLSPFSKRFLLKLGAGIHIHTMIVHSAAQFVVATNALGRPDGRVIRLPFQVDTHFWRPLSLTEVDKEIIRSTEQRPIICVPGLERRDYPTLLAAANGLDVNFLISTRLITAQQARLANLPDWPANVSFKQYDFKTLQQLYTISRFVVIPLLEVDFQAGITVILEAMAMGKAVVVSGIRGQTDVIRDPRNNGRGLVEREWWPGFLDSPEFADTLGHLPTGFYVTPGDPDELRETIQYLLDHPEVADELGRNGRRIVEAYFSLEAFAERFAAAILGEARTANLNMARDSFVLK